MFVLTAALVTRVWRVVDLVAGEASFATILWLPLLIGRDLLLALGIAALAIAVSGVRLPALIAYGVSGAAAVAVVLWRCANVLCYRVLQGPITLPRLTGREGARAQDLGLLEWRDVWPIGLLALALVAVLPLAILGAARVAPRRRAAALLGALALGVVLTAADALALRRANFGLAEEPVAVFLASSLPEWREPPHVDVSATNLDELERARTPSLGRDPGGVERKAARVKNVVLFFAEGIPRSFTGAENTPNLTRRSSTAGLELERYYSPFHKSINAIFSAVCSEWPPPSGRNITLLAPRIDCGELSEVTRSWGVHAGLFHAGEFAFYDKLALLGARGYEVQQDAAVLRAGQFESTRWGVDDRAMVQSMLAWVDSLPADERFVANMITLSPHYPYLLPSDVPIEMRDGSEGDRYVAALRFLDVVFEELMVGLEERGLADDTAVIFTADHGESIGEPLRQSPGRRLAYDSNLHVPFVIFAPRMFPQRQVSARPGSHVDVLPTILDLLGLPPVPQHRGQSLVSAEWTEKRVFFGASNGPDNYVGFMDGFTKVIVNRASGGAELYDLRDDPVELNNAFDDSSAAHSALVTDALAFHTVQTARLSEAPEVNSRVDVEKLVADAATVRLVRGSNGVEERIECPRGVCPGAADPLSHGVRDLRVGDRERRCLAVRVPAPGEQLEIDLVDPLVLSMLTLVRFGVGPTGARSSGALEVSAQSDDAPAIARSLTRDLASMRFEAPTRRLRVHVSGDAFDGLVCLAFSNADWR